MSEDGDEDEEISFGDEWRGGVDFLGDGVVIGSSNNVCVGKSSAGDKRDCADDEDCER